jgi:hypothetical protein
MATGEPSQPESSPADQPRERIAPRLVRAAISPDSYGLVLVLVIITYIISAAVTSTRSASLVLAVQIATVWVTLRASRARPAAQNLANVVLVFTAVVAVGNIFWPHNHGTEATMSVISCFLYLIAPLSVLRHLIFRRVIDLETILGAVVAYLLAGMFYAFLYQTVARIGAMPLYGSAGDGSLSEDMFFSFTTLTTTGYGNLVPAGNPGQTIAVTEMLIGQLFLVTALGKVVSNWSPIANRRQGLNTSAANDDTG